jgi:hypothetical protein
LKEKAKSFDFISAVPTDMQDTYYYFWVSGRRRKRASFQYMDGVRMRIRKRGFYGFLCEFLNDFPWGNGSFLYIYLIRFRLFGFRSVRRCTHYIIYIVWGGVNSGFQSRDWNSEARDWKSQF